MGKKKLTFEEALIRLEEVLELIEKGEIDLEESVKLYKEGLELSFFCSEKLNKVEEEITLLKESVV